MKFDNMSINALNNLLIDCKEAGNVLQLQHRIRALCLRLSLHELMLEALKQSNFNSILEEELRKRLKIGRELFLVDVLDQVLDCISLDTVLSLVEIPNSIVSDRARVYLGQRENAGNKVLGSQNEK